MRSYKKHQSQKINNQKIRNDQEKLTLEENVPIIIYEESSVFRTFKNGLKTMISILTLLAVGAGISVGVYYVIQIFQGGL